MHFPTLRHSFLLLALFFSSCDRRNPAVPPASSSSTAPAGLQARNPSSPGLFSEVTAGVGLPANPPSYPDGTYLLPEQEPGGVALLDVNNDGLLDILLIAHPPPGPDEFRQTQPNRLFQQTKDGHFLEVQNAAGLAGKGCHVGVAVGDIDNDGFPDVYVTNYASPDQLFHNNGDGTFTDITSKAGLPTAPNPLNFSTAAAFFDFDGDGLLDLVVARYAVIDNLKPCLNNDDPTNIDYCGPRSYPGQLAILYHNNGDGTFTDVTRKAGIDQPAHGLGLIAADIFGAGRPDIFQTDDREPNQLWINQGNGVFKDEAVLRGCAFNAHGATPANMGIAAGDIFNTGQIDLFITHLTNETNIVYKNNGDGTFTDWTSQAGMAPVDRLVSGWGCGLFDFDNDGNLDVATSNGRVKRGPAIPAARLGKFWSRYAEPNLLFQGDGHGRFTDVSAKAPGFTSRIEVHHALAFADLQNRGAIDLVEVNVDNMLRVFRNNAAPASGNHWLQVLPMIGKREALGARVTLTAGGQIRLALCLRSYSYLASNDPRVHFGLGKLDKVESLYVEWPSGIPRKERFDVPAVDRDLVVVQGRGTPL